MIRITRMTDYGIVLLTHFASGPEWKIHTVRDLAAEAHLPLPTVSKLLKLLARSGMLVSHRGIKGGYTLARQPGKITVADIIGAIDGPIAITDCSSHDEDGRCELERSCPVRANWQRINLSIHDALANITLAEMLQPLPAGHAPLGQRTFKGTRTEVLELCPR